MVSRPISKKRKRLKTTTRLNLRKLVAMLLSY